MSLHLLPTRTGGAAENMALDFLLLQRYPEPGAVRFRHYEWRRPAFTFGYGQRIAFVQRQLSATAEDAAGCELCRRPTGGGFVDHRDDWTYALVLPRGHPLEELRATQSYRAVHDALAAALRAQGVPATTKLSEEQCAGAQGGTLAGRTPGEVTSAPAADAAGICFQRAEIYDVVHERSAEKIAGAAQKRNKHGLLLQGSIWRPAAGSAVDWRRFHDDFSTQLAAMLEAEPAPVTWPDFNEDEVSGLTEQYSSREWMELR